MHYFLDRLHSYSRPLYGFIYPLTIIFAREAVTRKEWHMTYKFILPWMWRSYQFSISMCSSLGMDPRMSILCISSMWFLLFPHFLCLVGSNISLSSTDRRFYLLYFHVLSFGESTFSHLPFSFGICIVPPSCSIGLHPCLHVFTGCG